MYVLSTSVYKPLKGSGYDLFSRKGGETTNRFHGKYRSKGKWLLILLKLLSFQRIFYEKELFKFLNMIYIICIAIIVKPSKEYTSTFYDF